MFRLLLSFVAAAALANSAHAKSYQELFGGMPQNEAVRTVLSEVDFQQGDIRIGEASITLHVPSGFYYLDPKDTTTVLADLWGNPPSATTGTLGMLFPAKYPPEALEAWGSVISYSDDGHVSDAEADSTDYDELLKQLQQSTRESNVQRAEEGYETVQLVGWASAPYYDKTNHALHWARDLVFGIDADTPHTLNYQLRVLGREGVLELNFVASMDQLDEIKENIPSTIAMMSYDAGRKYSDYRSGDRLAEYGLAGLIAAGAGTKLAAKAGLIAVLIAFLKKGFVLVLIVAGAVWRFASGLFRGKTATAATTGPEAETDDSA